MWSDLLIGVVFGAIVFFAMPRRQTRPVALVGILLFFFLIQIARAISPSLASAHLIPNYAIASYCLLAVFAERPGVDMRSRVLIQMYWTGLFIVLFYTTSIINSHFDVHRFVTFVVPYSVLFLLLEPLLAGIPRALLSALTMIPVLCAVLVYIPVLIGSHSLTEASRLTVIATTLSGESMLQNPLALADALSYGFMIGVLSLLMPTRILLLTLPAALVCLYSALRASRGEPMAALVSLVIVGGIHFISRPRTMPVRRILILGSLAIFVTLVVVLVVANPAWADRWSAPRLMDASLDRINIASSLLREYGNTPSSWAFGLGGDFCEVRFAGTYPHMQAVQALCEVGIVGLVIWLVLILGPTIQSLIAVYRSRVGASAFVSACIAALLIYHGLLSLKRGHVIDMMWFGLLLVAVAASGVPEGRSSSGR